MANQNFESTPALTIKPVNDSVPGILPKIPGGNMVPVSNADGSGMTYISVAEVGTEGPEGPPGADGAPGPAGPPGNRVAAINAVQTLALTGFTFNAGTGTWTATSNGALPSPWTLFDGLTAVNGKRVEVNSLGTAAVGNGVFNVNDGTAGTPATLTRVADLSTSGQFVGGVSYEVLEGSTLASAKGTRRQLTTTAVVVLNATALLFDQVRERPLIFIDLTKPPYNVRGFATVALAVASGLDFAPTIALAMADAAALSPAAPGVPNGAIPLLKPPHGVIPCRSPIFCDGNISLQGADRQSTTFNFSAMPGGPCFYFGKPILPTIGAASSGQTGAISILLDNAHWVNLTESGTCSWSRPSDTPDSNLEIRYRFNKSAGDGAGVAGMLMSTRGALNHTNAAANEIGVMHYLQLLDTGANTASQVRAFLRTLDKDNLKQTAGATSHAVVLTGTAIPHRVPIHIEILSSTTFRYSLNMRFTWIKNTNVATSDPLYGTEVHTINNGGTYALNDRARGTISPGAASSFISFPAGTYAADERYSTVQETLLTAPQQVTYGATKYEIAHIYNGTTVTLAVNNVTTNTGDATTLASAAQTGRVISFPYEETLIGAPWNDEFMQVSATQGGASHLFGGVRVNSLVTGTAANAAPGGNLSIVTSNMKLGFIPFDTTAAGTNTPVLGADGAIRAWRCQSTAGVTYVYPFTGSANFNANVSFKRCQIDQGASRTTALTMHNVVFFEVEHLGIVGGGSGIRQFGPTFFGHYADLRIKTSGTYGLAEVGPCSINVKGRNFIDGQDIPVYFAACGGMIDHINVDGQGNPTVGIVFNQVQDTEAFLLVSDESSSSLGNVQGAWPGGMIVASVQAKQLLKIRGISGCVGTKTPALVLDGSTVDRGKVLYGMNIAVRSDAPNRFQVTGKARANGVPYVELVAGYGVYDASTTALLSDYPEYFIQTKDNPIDDPTALTDASVTVKRGTAAWFKLATNTLTANRTLTLAATGVRKGQLLRLDVLPQATYTFAIVNGGSGGGTLETVSAATALRGRVYYFNGVDWEIYQ